MIGKTLLHYEIRTKIGAGGMGEVYRAFDEKLGRDVALKILPVEMSGDSDRNARFVREARTLATLQHPNIASIYGFEQQGDTRFLIMELVEGEDLSQRLTRGPIPLEEATEFALQLTNGLEAAHAQGITHRDLKPANIKLGPDGQLKILDFGLARVYTGDPDGSPDSGTSPTLTAAMTQVGVILGTAAYMSPEQARGRTVDQRADVWAFGVILFEMLTGRQLFAGETVSDTLAAVLRAEPDWDSLPSETPSNLRRLLRRCLTRKPRERLRDVGDARLELLEQESLPTGGPAAVRSRLWPAALAFLALAILIAAWILKPGESAAPGREPTHLTLTLPDGLQVASRDQLPLGAPQPCLTISDDGRLIVVVVERDDTTWLYRRFLDEPEGDILEDSRGGYHPRISPGGEWISFMAGNTLMRMAARGDRATRLVDLPNSFGHDWLSDGEIIINRSEAKQLLRLDAERGTYTAFENLTDLDEYFWPHRIPGTNKILFNSDSHVAKSAETDVDAVSLMDLDNESRTLVGIGGSQPQRLADGSLLLVRDGVLKAAPFDLDDPGALTRAATVLEQMLIEGWIGQYAVSQNGTMAYVPGDWLFGTELVWDDGSGGIESLDFPLLGYGDFELSPDGTMLAITVGGGPDQQSWTYDLDRGARRLLTTDGTGGSPIWSPDGQRLVYTSFEEDRSTLMIRTLGSTESAAIIESSKAWLAAYAWHAETGLLFNLGTDIYLIDPTNPGEPRPMVATDASEWGPDISPDGRWMAYTSDESGRYEIYVRAIDGQRSWTVSLDGGEEPIFSADGKTLYYRSGNRFYGTPILEASADGQRFQPGQPQVLVEGAYSNVPGLSYDVGPDGRLLLLRSAGGPERPGHLNVILDWDVEVARKLERQ